MGFCAKSECLNNGTCFNVENDYECKCPAEYEGRHCERMKDQCRDRNSDCEGNLECSFKKNTVYPVNNSIETATGALNVLRKLNTKLLNI